MAAHLDGNHTNGSTGEDVFVFPTTVAQRRFWLLDQIEPGNPALNVPLAARLHGRLDRALLDRTVNEILRRHEILRTSFRMIDGKVVQVIHSERHITLGWYDITNCPGPECEDRVHQLMIQEGVRPFVLSEGPLLRGGLIKIRDDEHVLMLTMHHIGCDGWSNGVLMKEVAQIYSGFMLGVENHPELPLQYADFAQWQEEWLKGPDAAEQLQFWRSRLKGVLPVLNMPTDRPRGARRSHAGTIHTLLLPSDLGEALKSLCSREDVTPFMLFFATYATLLFRYTGNTDIIVGSPAANRTQADLEGLIGLFANPLVLRLDLSGNPTFRVLLSRVKELSLEAFANQSYPFEKLVEEIQTNSARAGLPWLQAYFVFQKAFMTPQQMPELSLNPLRSISPGAMFEWSLGVLERNEGIRLQLEYNTDLYDQSTIDRMLHHFQRLLEGILVDSSARICELPIMTPEEVRQLTVDWNRTELKVPRGRCVHELIEEQARRTPEAVAAYGVGIQCSYLQMNARANQVAHFLRSHGVGPSSLVGLAADDSSMEFLIGFLGILKAGGCCVFMDPQSDANLDRSIQHSRLGVLLINSSSRAPEWTSGLKVICFDADAAGINSMPGDNLPNVVLLDQPACVRFSSGSSGAPRGAVLSHQAMLNSAFGNWRELGLQPQDRIASTVDELLPALLSGASLILNTKDKEFNPEGWVAWVRSQRVTVAALPTARWQEVVRRIGQNGDSSMGELRLMAIGGSRISPAALRTWQSGAGGKIRLVDRFLLAEVGGVGAFSDPISRGDLTARASIERPAPNLHIYLLDANLQPVPIGVPGDLYVGGDGLASDYLNGSEPRTSDFIVSGFSGTLGERLLKTGDRGRFLTGGAIELVGCVEDLAKTNGFQLELCEIPEVLRSHPAVWDVVVVPFEDAECKKIAAYLVGKAGASIQSAEVRAFAKSRFPGYMVPSKFVTLDKFPLTRKGKVDCKAMPKHECDLPADKFVQPGTPTEIVLARIWCELLGLKQVGIHDNFFELGGHSLLATRLINEINRTLSLNLTIPVFFRNPTIKRLATVFEQENLVKRESKLIQLQPGRSAGILFLLDVSIGLCRLAEHLAEAGPAIFGTVVPLSHETFRTASLNQIDNMPRLQDLAAAHAALIRSYKLPGPCLLAGHSFGGLLAFEVAHQLRREGIQVEMIFLLDSWAGGLPWWRKLKGLTLERAGKSLKFRANRWWKGALARSAKAAGWLSDISSSRNRDRHGSEDINLPFGEVTWEILSNVYRNARKNYRMHPLESRALLFRAQAGAAAHLYGIDGTMGWSGWFGGGVEVVDCPGDHFTLLKAPHLHFVVQHFEKSLERLSRASRT